LITTAKQQPKRQRPVGTTARERLQDRRLSETFNFQCNGLAYTATISRFADGRLAEIFLGNAKAGSHSDATARDSAVVCSLALHHGVQADTIRHALLRDPRGVASSPLGQALDIIAAESPR
jgi:ribonucleoside-diphosphate reductase alpha chain